ncbi:endonuclease/exonuclease/phosphatase family protein [Micromonospora sp. NPDC003197]
MRRPAPATVAVCLGILVLVDVLRIWLPGIITIFGQAASTPAELMGAFALLWFLLPLATPVLIRRTGPRPVASIAVVVLAAARLALTSTPGGQLQLYLASVGLLAGLVWLAATAATTVRPGPGLVFGLALGAALHTALDTYDLVWRGGWLAWTVSAVLAVLLVAAQMAVPAPETAAAARTASGGGDVRTWLLVGPTVLFTGMVALSPAVAGSTASYLFADNARTPDNAWIAQPSYLADLPQGALVGGSVGLLVLTALARPVRGALWTAPLTLVIGVGGLATSLPRLWGYAIWWTAYGLGLCLALTGTTAPPPAAAASGTAGTSPPSPVRGTVDPAGLRRSFAALAGMLGFVVAAIVYYAAYDLGYPNWRVPIVMAGLVIAVTLWDTKAVTGSWWSNFSTRPPERIAAAGLAGLTLLAAVVIPGHLREPAPDQTSGPVRLVAYNIRMGFGLDGRFDLTGLVDVIARQRPDVVVLSEVDRGWLLNGGHDTLELLARRLDLPYRFAPAADPVWGDAVLTRLPIRHSKSLALPRVGAPTGAQALAVTLDLAGREVVVVSTHLQPPPDDGPVVQARAVARFATEYAAGRPLVVAGDMNTEPGEPAFAEFTNAGLVDALAAARPLPTSPADRPGQQIDHVFVSAGILPSEAGAARSTASDHLPVAVTLAVN